MNRIENLLLLNKDVVLSTFSLLFFLLVLTRFFLKMGKSSLMKWRSCSDGWARDKLLDADSFVGMFA